MLFFCQIIQSSFQKMLSSRWAASVFFSRAVAELPKLLEDATQISWPRKIGSSEVTFSACFR